MAPRLKTRYEDEILPNLAEKLGRKNRLSLPRLEKIVVNMGVGDAIQEKKYLESATDALTQITGQKPVVTTARKAIAGFRLRQGMFVGARSEQMLEDGPFATRFRHLDRLLHRGI